MSYIVTSLALLDRVQPNLHSRPGSISADPLGNAQLSCTGRAFLEILESLLGFPQQILHNL
jgi:hypothetical protein